MSKDPAVLFYTSDFLTGTEFFSFEEKGKYVHLLCTQHQNGHLPESYMLKIIGDKTNQVWNKFIKDNEGLYFNVRMDEETKRRKNFTESRKKNISKRYETTSVDTHETTSVEIMKPHMETVTDTITKDVINTNKENRFNKEKILQYFSDKRYPETEAELFYNHYESQGWVTGSGLPITNWKLKAENWHKEQQRRNSDETYKRSNKGNRNKQAVGDGFDITTDTENNYYDVLKH